MFILLEQSVDLCFDVLCNGFGNDASLDDLVEYLAAALLVEQLDGILEQLGSKLLDDGGGRLVVKQFLNGQASEIHGSSPSQNNFRLAYAIAKIVSYGSR